MISASRPRPRRRRPAAAPATDRRGAARKVAEGEDEGGIRVASRVAAAGWAAAAIRVTVRRCGSAGRSPSLGLLAHCAADPSDTPLSEMRCRRTCAAVLTAARLPLAVRCSALSTVVAVAVRRIWCWRPTSSPTSVSRRWRGREGTRPWPVRITWGCLSSSSSVADHSAPLPFDHRPLLVAGCAAVTAAGLRCAGCRSIDRVRISE